MADLLNRELTVLGSGLYDGLGQTVDQTWDGIRSEAYKFSQAPLAATGDYLYRHAADFGTGAAIAMVAPKGAASKLLVAWSLRGVGVATIGAITKAGDPNSDPQQVGAEFAKDLSTEGTHFLSSMPMAMAGGMAGRSVANTFLGRGNVLPDLATGKVTLQDVRRNTSSLLDAVAPKKPKVLLTDLDDTLFSLQEYLIPMLQKNAKMLGDRMGMTDIEAIRALGPERIHPWILEESPLARQWKGTPAEFTRDVVKPFWENDAAALKQAKAYATVEQTLTLAREQGIKAVVQTNAPAPWAIRRLTQIGLDSKIDHLIAIETPKPSPGRVVAPEALEHGQMLLDQALNLPHQIGKITTLPPGYRKPDIRGLAQVLDELQVKPREVLAIGDNLKGDGAAPRYHGVPFVWAEWGHKIKPELADFMGQIHVRTDGVTVSPPVLPKDALLPKPIGTAYQYADVLGFINRKPSLSLLWEQARPDLSVRNVLLPTTAYNLVPEWFKSSDRKDNK